MTFRENTLAILNYKPYEKMPVVSFGFWSETVQKWADEKHITQQEASEYIKQGDNSGGDKAIMKKLGFDFNWNSCISLTNQLFPRFEVKIIKKESDGCRIIMDGDGLIVREKPGVVSISGEIGTTLKDRESWENLYLPKLQMSKNRIPYDCIRALPKIEDRTIPIGLHIGSLIGYMRNILGVENLSYLYYDDEELYIEIIDTLCNLCYECAEEALKIGVAFDYAHFWEDICFKNGPLVSPAVVEKLYGPWYKKLTDLVKAYGIDIISLDCDGCIDLLIPTWLHNGVNTMFPIEVGTWNASILPWRETYGKELRGVGGMNKTVFAKELADVDNEVERLKSLIALGGYIPCPDHRIAPDAKWENVKYYCEKMQQLKI